MKPTTTTADELFADIASDVSRFVEPIMDAASAQVKERIGVPVDKSRRPWTRSKPGEPPRKDTGALQASITAITAAVNDVVESILYTDRKYAPILEGGMDRLIMTDWIDRYLNLILDAHVKGIEGA